MKLSELAAAVSGEIAGDQDPQIKGLAALHNASSGDLVFLLEEKHLAEALKSPAAAIVAAKSVKYSSKPLLLVSDPRLALAKISALFAPPKPKPGVHPTAIVPASCRLGQNVSIGPYTVLGENVEVGDETIIYPQVVIYDRTRIGRRVVIHSGCTIGIDGYGFAQENKKHVKIHQLGRVIIEDDVELFANVCISRGTLENTVVGAGTKVDNLTHIAHNCKIGKNCAIVSLVGFAGSVTLGDNVYVAGQAGFNGHITIGENTVVMAKSGVTKDIPANSVVSGFPAQEHGKENRLQAALRLLAKKQK